jgi:ferredoxin--NADP+ reductase
MAYAITQSCCADATCVSVCPVNCIHPTPDEAGFVEATMLHVDPRACIDCGACADACPVDAVIPVDALTSSTAEYAELNASYYATEADTAPWSAPVFPRSLPAGVAAPRVAIVGTGPAAAYTAKALLRGTDAEISMIEKLPVPGGLVRYGVAPDHPSTKRIGDGFAAVYRHPRVRLHTNLEIGRDLSHEELAAHHHAVIYAVGATADRPLGIPGEDLPGVVSAMELVSWYNAHPDAPGPVDLSAERAVVIGNGNVALDVARILVADPDELARTDIADHALAALRSSRVREVVVLGRRGPNEAAYTASELLALRHLPGVELLLDADPGTRAAIDVAAAGGKAALLRDIPTVHPDWSAPPPPGRRLILRFHSAPVSIDGPDRVRSVQAGDQRLAAGLVIRATGNRGTPVAGLPFDQATATVPHSRGRVHPGTYVVGWIKRGATGGIGANRTCAQETVDALLDDAAAHLLPTPPRSTQDFARLVRRRR